MLRKIPFDRYIVIQKAIIILITFHSLIKAYQRFDKTVEDFFMDNPGDAFPKDKLLELSLTGFYVVTFNIAFMLVLFLVLSFFIVLFNNMSRQKMIEDITVIAEAASAAAVAGAAKGAASAAKGIADMGLASVKTAAKGALSMAQNDLVQAGVLGSLGIANAGDKLKALKKNGLKGLVNETLGPEIGDLANTGQAMLKEGKDMLREGADALKDGTNMLREGADMAKGAASTLKNQAQGVVDGAKNMFQEEAGALADQLKNASAAKVAGLKKGLGDELNNATSDIKNSAMSFMSKGVKGFKGKMQAAASAVESAASSAANAVEGVVDNAASSAANAVENAVEQGQTAAKDVQTGGGWFGIGEPSNEEEPFQDGPPPKPCSEMDTEHACQDSMFWRIESLFYFFYNSLYSYWVILCVGYSVVHYIMFRIFLGVVQSPAQLQKKEHLQAVNFYFVTTYALGVFSLLYKL